MKLKINKTRFSTQLSDLYGRDNYQSHIEAGREFWWFWETDSDVYRSTKQHWNRLKITYVRSGVAFYILPDFPDVAENFFPINCFMASTLIYAQIDPMVDLFWDGTDKGKPREYLEKRYCFDDERTKVLNWNNSSECELEGNEMDFFDMFKIGNDIIQQL